MKQVDEARLENDVEYRYAYLSEFIGFDREDIAMIHASAGELAPLIPDLVDRTYVKLLSYDATARHFLPRQHGFTGPTPVSLSELTANHAQIQFRKEHLNRYLMQIIGHSYNSKMIAYLDMVGKMHTEKAGNKEIVVPLVQMNALMGLLNDVVAEAIIQLGLDADSTHKTLRAFSKLFWIQSDLISRHYVRG